MEIKPTLKKEAASKTEVVDTVAVQVQKVATNPSEKIPSNWTIVADGDNVTAYNNVTRRNFSGTIQEFNELLRG